MGVKDPSDISRAFGEAFNRRDREALMALYADDAVFTMDGQAVVSGKAAIREALQSFFDSPLKIAIGCGVCHVAGDTALVRSDWRLTDPSGAVAGEGSSAEVLRRGADGAWRFVIDDATYASRGRG